MNLEETRNLNRQQVIDAIDDGTLQINDECFLWTIDKGLVYEDNLEWTWDKQCWKMMEEIAELELAIDKRDAGEIEGELGDCLFVLSNLVNISKLKIESKDVMDDNKAVILSKVDLFKNINRFKDTKSVIETINKAIFNSISEINDLGIDIEPDLRYILYKTLIKNADKSGKNINGNFVKQEDLEKENK